MENLEITHFNKTSAEGPKKPEDIDKFNKDLDRQCEELVRNILEKKTGLFLGSGGIARVYLPETNKQICFKITCYREVAGRGAAKDAAMNDEDRIRITTEILPSDQEKGYHLPKEEGEYLEKVSDIGGDVQIPSPFSAATFEREEWGNGYMIKEHIHILGMDRLNAVSLEDVLMGKADLPPSFEPKGFFAKIRDFLDKMHHTKNIYHRDLHQGNVMIDIKTGSPCIIDFGMAINAPEDWAYDKDYRDSDGNLHHTKFTKDEDWANELERRMEAYIRDNIQL
jgi:serine/threonine protein kinase